MKKHILFITNSTISGGAEIYLKNLINGLNDFDLKMGLICPAQGEVLELFRELKINKYHLPLGQGTIGLRGLNLYSPIMLIHYLRLKKLINEINQKNKIDLLFVQQDPKEKILAIASACKLKIPIMIIEHSKLHPWQKLPHFRWFYSYFANRANRLIAVSRAVKKSLIQIGVKRKKIKVVWNGVGVKKLNGDEIISLKKELGIEDKIIFGLCSRLTANKGVYDLLTAAKIVLKKNKRVVFVLVGSGKEEDNLQRKIKSLGLAKQILMFGFRKNAASLNSLFDVVVSPSFDEGEGLPLRIMEGMANAKSVIATDISGTKEEVKDGVNGYLIKPHDTQTLAEKILLLAQDPALREKMGQESQRIYQKRFTLAKMVAKTYKNIIEVIDQK